MKQKTIDRIVKSYVDTNKGQLSFFAKDKLDRQLLIAYSDNRNSRNSKYPVLYNYNKGKFTFTAQGVKFCQDILNETPQPKMCNFPDRIAQLSSSLIDLMAQMESLCNDMLEEHKYMTKCVNDAIEEKNKVLKRLQNAFNAIKDLG